MICPRCKIKITPRKSQGHSVPHWDCPQCKGKALHGPHRGIYFKTKMLDWLNGLAKKPSKATPLRCPNCSRSLNAIQLESEQGKFEVDLCPRCKTLWCDRHELEELKRVQNEEFPAATQVAPLIGAVPQVNFRYRSGIHSEFVILNSITQPGPLRLSLGIITLIILMSWVSLMGVKSAEVLYPYFAFSTDSSLGPHKIKWISSFFLNPNPQQFLIHSTLLWIVGAELEDLVGFFPVMIIFFSSTFGGNLLTFLLSHHPSRLHMGAGPAVAGILAYSILKYPQKQYRLQVTTNTGILRSNPVFHSLRLPGVLVLILFFIFQCLVKQNVSLLQFTGGALFGAVATALL